MSSQTCKNIAVYMTFVDIVSKNFMEYTLSSSSSFIYNFGRNNMRRFASDFKDFFRIMIYTLCLQQRNTKYDFGRS
jgi:hypothetical protein